MNKQQNSEKERIRKRETENQNQVPEQPVVGHGR